jgi:dTDP-4-dehydrorhamnose reductase
LKKNQGTIVILGAGGMLASAIEEILKNSPLPFHAFSEQQLDITDAAAVRAQISQISPSVIINTAAYTDVDGCEENVDLAFSVNGKGAGNVAKVSAELGARLIHISTDYVFDGTRESLYLPTDETNPQSVYGKSKLAGEEAIKESCEGYLILRTSWLFGPWGKNFVRTMLDLSNTGNEIRVVDDQKGCPTYTLDLANALVKLAHSDLRGIHHLTNAGNCTWYEFAKTIFQKVGKEVQLVPVTTEDFLRPAPRPRNSMLDSSTTIEFLGYNLPKWQDALENYLNQYLL